MEKKSIFKRTIKYVVLTLLGLVVLVNAAYSVHSLISDRPGRIIGRFMTVETGSMEPDIGEGALIYVVRVPAASLSPGDAVTVILDGQTVTHRLERVCEGELVTKGDENESADSPVSLGDYLGKVVLVIPRGAVLYEAFTSPGILAASAAVLVILLFTGPVVKIILKKQKKFRPGVTRISALAAAASMLLVVPGSTLARYSGTLEGEKAISAAEVNFTSNFMSAAGNHYEIVGWNCDDYNSVIKIRNSSNLLKYNEENVDIRYTVTVEKILSDDEGSYSTDYSIGLTPDYAEHTIESNGLRLTESTGELSCTGDGTVTGSGADGIMSLTTGVYTLEGGEERAHIFTLTVNARDENDNMTLSDGDVIKYRITAQSVDSEGFTQIIFADYSLTVTGSVDFIKEKQFDHSSGTQIAKFTIKSATIMSLPQRKVVIKWDKDTMYLNEYEINTLRLLANGTFDLDKDAGTLTFWMKAASSVSLEFYKRTAMLGASLSFVHTTPQEDGVYYEEFTIRVTP